MQMVRDPRQFEVIVTNNMFGDIVTDLAAGLQGGLGMAASGNILPERRRCSSRYTVVPADRGQERCKPVRRDPNRRDDAKAPGIHRGTRSNRSCCLGRRKTKENNTRYRREPGDD